MLEVKLLNARNYFVPGLIHLTSEEPSGELDNTKLTPQQKQWLLKAARLKSISIKKDGQDLVLSKVEKAPAKSKKESAELILKKAEEDRESLKKNAGILLDGAPTQVIKRIESVKDIALLKEALSTEKRPKVSQTLLTKLNTLTAALPGILGEGVSTKDVARAPGDMGYDVNEGE